MNTTDRDRRTGYLGPADDEAEPSPGTQKRMTVATCHHCEGGIIRSQDGVWEHITLNGTICE